jgi:hypothetical protein
VVFVNEATQKREDERQASTAVVRHPNAPIAMGQRGVQLATFEDAFRFAKAVIASGLAPKGIDTPEKALIAIQAGAELGFSPMRALSAMTVVNGRPGLYGEAALAKIRESGACSKPPTVKTEGEGDARRGVVRFQRRDMDEAMEVAFSIADAKKAGLWGKSGPWTQYPDDMLEWRAVARASKRYFSDILLGLGIAEELQDYPVDNSQRNFVPPAEPDPLLSAAVDAIVVPAEPQPAEPQAAEPPLSETVMTTDEQATVAAIDKLEGAIVTADSINTLNAVWQEAAPLVAKLSEKERRRLTRLYSQNALGFQPVKEK